MNCYLVPIHLIYYFTSRVLLSAIRNITPVWLLKTLGRKKVMIWLGLFLLLWNKGQRNRLYDFIFIWNSYLIHLENNHIMQQLRLNSSWNQQILSTVVTFIFVIPPFVMDWEVTTAVNYHYIILRRRLQQ